jgi:gamma-glutamylcyclotransferase (GGCT)/AIG2-like uncharacterized protein YtfP
VLNTLGTRIKKQRILRTAAVAECNYFFFYGSLMERFPNFNRYLKKQVCSIEVGYCPGYLYNLPLGFPGLIVPKQPCSTLVAGEIMRFHNPQKIIKALDRLEGYHPHSEEKSIYLRRKMTLFCATNTPLDQPRTIDAWVYTYPEEHLSYEHRKEVRIECGQWAAFSKPALGINSPEPFEKLNFCDELKKVIVDPLLLQQPLVQQALHPCAQFCRNSADCGHAKRIISNNNLPERKQE